MEGELDTMDTHNSYPKVTEEQMKKRISSVYFTRLPGGTTTICQITLDNGFTVIGDSACVSPETYIQTLGESIAYKSAFDKLWFLFGFLLKENIYNGR
jgi:hypothetical protein